METGLASDMAMHRPVLSAAAFAVLGAADDPTIADGIAHVGATGTTDVRLLAGTYPGFDQVETSTDGAPDTISHHIGRRSGRDLELAVVYTWPRPGIVAPWLLVGGALRRTSGSDDAGVRHETLAAGLEFGGGLALRPHPGLQVEVGPVVTLGWSDNSVEADPDSGTPAQEATRDAWYVSADLRAGLWCTIDRVQFGIVAGAASHMLEASTRADSQSPWTTHTYNGDGTFVLAGMGLRF